MLIRHWQSNDAVYLRPMIRECLRENFDAGADFVPSDKNVETLLETGLTAASNQEPVFLAELTDYPVGYLLWVPANGALDWRDKLLTGLGTYVLPRFRRSGVASALRHTAVDHAKQKGYQRVIGTAYHAVGLASVLRIGFHVVGQQVELYL